MGAIYGSKNRLYMRVVYRSRTRELYIEVRIGYIWEPYIGVVYGSYIWELYMEVRMGYM